MDAPCLDQCLLEAKEKPASSIGTLRQRGGGAVVHHMGAPGILASCMSEDMAMQESEPVWSTPITTPPPRLKRSRKSEADVFSSETPIRRLADDAFDATSINNNLLDTPAMHATLANSSQRIQVSFVPAAVTSTTTAGSASSSSPSRRSSSSRRSISRPACVAPVPEPAKSEETQEDVTMSPHPPPIGATTPTDSISPEVATFGVSALARVDTASAAAEASELVVTGASGESKKARHNLTERRRIIRMNELFDQLSAAIEEPDETPSLLSNLVVQPSATDVGEAPSAEDPNDPTARPKERSGASKAKVLEAALRCIRDLRSKLAEERLARPFLSITDLDDMASMCTVADSTNGGLDSTMDSTEPQEVSDYKDVAW